MTSTDAAETQPLLPRSPSTTPHAPPTTALASLAPYVIMLMSAFFNALMSTLSHVAETTYRLPPSCAMAICAAATVTLALAVIARDRLFYLFHLSPVQLLRLVLRGMLGAISSQLMYMSFTAIPAGTSVTIFYTSPAITSLLCSLFLSEPFTLALMAILLLNAVGVALVSHPVVLLSNVRAAWGVVDALAASLSAAGGYVLVKVMGTHVHFALNVLSYGVGCALIAMCTMSTADVLHLRYNVTGTLLALAGGVAGFISKSALNYALPLCPSGTGLVVRSLSVPMTYLIALLVSRERISMASMGGAAVMVLSVAALSLQSHKRSGTDDARWATETRETMDAALTEGEKAAARCA